MSFAARLGVTLAGVDGRESAGCRAGCLSGKRSRRPGRARRGRGAPFVEIAVDETAGRAAVVGDEPAAASPQRRLRGLKLPQSMISQANADSRLAGKAARRSIRRAIAGEAPDQIRPDGDRQEH